MSDLHSLNEAINKKAGRKLLPSIAVSLSLLALIFVTMKYLPIAFAGVVTAAVVLSVSELTRAFKTADFKVSQFQLSVATTALMVSSWFGGVAGLAVATALLLPILYFLILLKGITGFVKNSTAATFTLLYLGFFGGFLILLARPHDGLLNIATLVILVGCNDTFAYIFGVLLGKHALAEKISPNKTWEGFAGGLVFTAIGGALAFHYMLEYNPLIGAAVGVLCVITATVGDLIESALKRDLSIKDMGSLLPGHGGMLDRLDSALLTAPSLWCVLELIKRFS